MVSVNGTSGVNSDYTIKKHNQGTNVQNTNNNNSIFNVSNPDTKAVSNKTEAQNVDNQKISDAKKSCESDFASLKASGVNVSEWDQNNTCTLSHQGAKATVTIDNNGQVSFGGNIDKIMEHLKTSNSEEKQSVDNMNNFLENLNGEVLNQKLSSVKVNGNETEVMEFLVKTSDGKVESRYLDDSGKEVKADVN